MQGKIFNSEKMCASQNVTWQIQRFTFFSKNSIVNYIYNIEENIIRNINIYYFYFIINIKITTLFLQQFSLQKMCTIFLQKHEDGTHLFAGRIR